MVNRYRLRLAPRLGRAQGELFHPLPDRLVLANQKILTLQVGRAQAAGLLAGDRADPTDQVVKEPQEVHPGQEVHPSVLMVLAVVLGVVLAAHGVALNNNDEVVSKSDVGVSKRNFSHKSQLITPRQMLLSPREK